MTDVRVNAVIQARMGSTRLPGKVTEQLLGRPVLEWVVRAAQAAGRVDGVVVATTTDAGDDPLVELAMGLGAEVVRGSVDDVLSRFVLAVDEHPCDAVVRLTADCPMLDPTVIDAVVGAFLAAPTLDYVSSILVRTLPHGLDVELVRTDVLRAVDDAATGHDRVHVTSSIYTHPLDWSLMGVVFSPGASDLRVTVDTPEDLAAIRALVEVHGDRVGDHRAIARILRERPDIVAINASVRQKAIEEG